MEHEKRNNMEKSQRLGGISFIVGGIVIIAVCLFATNINYPMWIVGILIVLMAIDIYLTHRIAQKY